MGAGQTDRMGKGGGNRGGAGERGSLTNGNNNNISTTERPKNKQAKDSNNHTDNNHYHNTRATRRERDRCGQNRPKRVRVIGEVRVNVGGEEGSRERDTRQDEKRRSESLMNDGRVPINVHSIHNERPSTVHNKRRTNHKP